MEAMLFKIRNLLNGNNKKSNDIISTITNNSKPNEVNALPLTQVRAAQNQQQQNNNQTQYKPRIIPSVPPKGAVTTLVHDGNPASPQFALDHKIPSKYFRKLKEANIDINLLITSACQLLSKDQVKEEFKKVANFGYVRFLYANSLNDFGLISSPIPGMEFKVEIKPTGEGKVVWYDNRDRLAQMKGGCLLAAGGMVGGLVGWWLRGRQS